LEALRNQQLQGRRGLQVVLSGLTLVACGLSGTVDAMELGGVGFQSASSRGAGRAGLARGGARVVSYDPAARLMWPIDSPCAMGTPVVRIHPPQFERNDCQIGRAARASHGPGRCCLQPSSYVCSIFDNPPNPKSGASRRTRARALAKADPVPASLTHDGTSYSSRQDLDPSDS
jgi:hypothetical protein